MDKYYIILDKDDESELANSSSEAVVIAVTHEDRNTPIIFIEGKGKGGEGTCLSITSAYKKYFLDKFKENDIEWILTFISSNPKFTEIELEQEILSHNFPLVIRKY